jgi:hypothetical protein
MGQKVKEDKGTSIDISSLESGVYVLTILSKDGQTYIKRFVKQ